MSFGVPCAISSSVTIIIFVYVVVEAPEVPAAVAGLLV